MYQFCFLVALALLATAFCLTASADTIYRCESPDGSTIVSQFPCAKDAQPVKVTVGSGQNGRGSPGLSTAEKQLLEDAEERRAENRRDRKKQQEEKEELEEYRVMLEFRCEKAKQHLATIRDQRRRGYSANQRDYSQQRLNEAKEYEQSQCSKLREL